MRFFRDVSLLLARTVSALSIRGGAGALALLALVTPVCAAVSIRPEGADTRVSAAAYQAVFNAQGVLTELQVKGANFLAKPKDDLPALYFYRSVLIPITTLTREAGDALSSEGLGVRIQWTFWDDEIRAEIRNVRRTPVTAFLILGSHGASVDVTDPACAVFRRGDGVVGLLGGDGVVSFRGEHAWKAELPVGGARSVSIVFSEKSLKPAAKPKALSVATPDANLVTPWRRIVYTPGDIATIRRLAAAEERFQPTIRNWFAVAERWMAYSEEELERLLPPYDAAFADGMTSGDPKTNQNWTRRGGGGICSLDRPGEVRSPFTGDVYGIQKPGEPYYDSGDGWVRPEDGTRFFFKGIWNSYVITRVLGAVDSMAQVWLLTGDERVARRILFLMDRMATMRARRGRFDGPADWPYPLRENQGFFCFEGNQANTQIYQLCLTFDLLARTPFAAEPSWTNGGSGLSVLENIRDHLLQVIEPESMDDLQNHGLSAYSAFLARALLFGEADNIRRGIAATYAFLDNCVDRDGEYYEVSASYGGLGYGYGGRLVELLRNYSPDNYEPASARSLPARSEYPFAMDFGSDPRWIALAVKSQYRLDVLGRDLNYGDAWPDRDVRTEAGTRERLVLRDAILVLHAQVSREDWKRELAALYWSLPAYLRERPTFGRGGAAHWMEPPKPSESSATVTPTESILLGGKITALLRGGEGKEARALFMRGGHAESHAHDDQMAISVYGRGMMVTGEFGYGYWGTPDHVGFGTRAVAHKTVVIDEDLPSSDALYRSAPSASVTAFVDRGPAQVVEMRNPRLWPDVSRVSEYTRQSWLVDVDERDFYVADIFRVTGGSVHDYVWDAPFLSPPGDNDGFSIEGVTPRPVPGAWTLAAHWNPENRDAEWNRPGRSWGERLLGRTGRLLDQPEGTAGRRWNPPPGNGYGFVYDIKAAGTTKPWAAEWDLHDGRSRMRFSMLPFDGEQTVVTGRSGTLETGHRHAVVVARRKSDGGNSLRSRFVSLAQVADREGDWPVARFESLVPERGEKDAIAVRTTLKKGGHDVLLANSRGPALLQAGQVALQGERGFVRFDSESAPRVLMLSHGTRLQAGAVAIEFSVSEVSGRVSGLRAGRAENKVKVDGPVFSAAAGSPVFFSSSEKAPVPYAANEYYKVLSTTGDAGRSGELDLGEWQSLVLARLEVDRVDGNALALKWPNMIGGTPRMRAFAGRRVVAGNDASKEAIIRNLKDRRRVELAGSASVFRPGDSLEVRAVQSGDRWEIPSFALLEKEGEGWRVRVNQPVRITLPADEGARFEVRSRATGERRARIAAGRGGLSCVFDAATLGYGDLLVVPVHSL